MSPLSLEISSGVTSISSTSMGIEAVSLTGVGWSMMPLRVQMPMRMNQAAASVVPHVCSSSWAVFRRRYASTSSDSSATATAEAAASSRPTKASATRPDSSPARSHGHRHPRPCPAPRPCLGHRRPKWSADDRPRVAPLGHELGGVSIAHRAEAHNPLVTDRTGIRLRNSTKASASSDCRCQSWGVAKLRWIAGCR